MTSTNHTGHFLTARQPLTSGRTPARSTTRGPAIARFAAALLLATLPLLASAAQAFDLQAHRGGRGLRPENTLAAFENALAMGVTTLELDIAITADGVPGVSHDPHLNPAFTRDAKGQWLTGAGPLIRTLTLEQVQSYDVGRLNPAHNYGKAFAEQQAQDGQRIPTLAALFRRVKELGADDVQFDIETKVFPNRPADTLPPEDFVKALLAVVREAGMVRRVMVQSFDWRTLKLVQAMEPGMRTVYLTLQSRNTNNVEDPAWTGGMLVRDHASVAHMVKAAGGPIWSPNFNNIDAEAVQRAQQLGLKVLPWTVNESADMRRLIDWGVDGIISDRPDRLREVMRERGMVLPAGIAR
jgi:glycerophosphoryl diester phosphodiesterase